jgi:hypothetical protein
MAELHHAERALVAHMRLVMAVKARGGVKTAYLGFEDYVLRHGKFFHRDAGRAEREFENTTARECFTNALMGAVWHDDLTYVEGYAWNGLLPVHHAWLVDKEGRVFDPTWEALDHDLSDAVYLGVAFDTKYATRTVTEKGTDTLLDWMGKGVPLDKAPTEEMLADVPGREVPEELRGVDAELVAKFDLLNC